MSTGVAAGAGILGLSKFGVGTTEAANPEPLRYVGKKIVVENARKIYSAPSDVPLKYCGWPDIVFWQGKYYVIFSRKNRHHPDPLDGPGLVVIESTDLENWSEQVLPDFSKMDGGEMKGDDRDSKLFATPERLFALNVPFPFDTYISHTEDGVTWSPWKKAYPAGDQFVSNYPTYGAQCWRPKQYKGTYYMPCDYTTDRVDLLKSKDMLNWELAGTIMSGSKYKHTNAPTETEIVFLEDGRCLAFTRMNKVDTYTHPQNTLPGFSIASPPYTSWDFTLGNAIRFGGPAVHRFGDTILVVARAELGKGPGYWHFPTESRWPWRTAVYTFDLDRMRLEQQALLPTEYAHDSSYAGILPTGDNSALVVWYDGDTTDTSNIWLARLSIKS